MITFEYPMSEKGRTYLRFEFLFSQMKNAMLFESESDDVAFFKALFECLELHERTDCRHDFIKDLRGLSDQLSAWLKYEGVDKVAILDLVKEVNDFINNISKMPKQLRYFKGNRFLMSLKQRISIPSGTCSFDLPYYHFWKLSGIENKQRDAAHWFAQFDVFYHSLTLFLKLKRAQGILESQVALDGFHQGSV